MSDKWISLKKPERLYLARLLSAAEDGPLKDRLASKLQAVERPIKRASAKDKGLGLQKWVCARIAAILGIPYDQQDDQCEIHSREGGQSGVDIILRGSAYQRFRFDIECKSTNSLSLASAIKQAQANNKRRDQDWLVVHKSKVLATPVVIMDWSAFERLVLDRLANPFPQLNSKERG